MTPDTCLPRLFSPSLFILANSTKRHKSVKAEANRAAKPNRLMSADRAGWEKKKKKRERRKKRKVGEALEAVAPLKSEALLRVGTLLGR